MLVGNQLLKFAVPVVVIETYDEPLNPTYFVTSEAYRAYVELFYQRPLSKRILKRTVHIIN